MKWFNSKEKFDRNKLILETSSQIIRYKNTHKTSLPDIKKKRWEKVLEKVRQKEIQDRERLREHTQYTNNIVRHGLWQSEDNMLLSYYKTEKS